MKVLIVVIVAVFLIQIVLFVITRKKMKKEKSESLIEKYNIKTPGDVWRLLNDPNIPEEDRIKLQELHQTREE